MLSALGLATVKKRAPKLKLEPANQAADVNASTLQGVITHRYEILARYGDIVRHAVSEELAKLKHTQETESNSNWLSLKRCRIWLSRSEEVLEPEQLAEVDSVLAQNQSLSTLVQMRRDLARVWESSSASSEQLLADLQAWCQRAQQSGNESLEQFAYRLRRYAA